MSTSIPVGERIRRRRVILNMTQRELGKMAGYAPSLIGKVELGQTCNFRAIERITQALKSVEDKQKQSA